MGRTKGDLPADGCRSLAERAALALAPVCAGVVISVRPGAANPAPGYPAVEDRLPAGRGPLAGIHAAFEAVSGADLLVLACDYPRVDTELVVRLVERARAEDDLVIFTDGGGRDHPLVGLWRARTAERIGCALERGQFQVRQVIATWSIRRLGREEFTALELDRWLVNLNEPADLAGLR